MPRRNRNVMCLACRRASVVPWPTAHTEGTCPRGDCQVDGMVRVGSYTNSPTTTEETA